MHQLLQSIQGYGTALAQTTGYGYDALGRVVTTTVGLGTALARTDVTVYNADNTVAQTIQNYQDGVFSASAPDADIITSYRYDGLGRQVAVTDALGHVDLTHYDAQGRVDWSMRNAVPATFESSGLPLFQSFSVAAPDRNVSTLYGYDGLGRTSFVTETGILTGSFDASTQQFSSSTSRTTRTQYDDLSRPVTTTLNYRAGLPSSADTNVATYTRYDGAGNVITQTDALSRWTTYGYDALNRVVTTTLNYDDGDPTTGAADTDLVSVTRYDVLGRAYAQIDNYVDGSFSATAPITDQLSLTAYDTLSRVISSTLVVAPLSTTSDTNRTSLTAYDPASTRMLGQRDALGRWSSQQYDLLGRVVRTVQNCRTSANAPVASGCATFTPTLPDRNVASTMGYDALGRTVVMTDALGVATHSSFDGLGRTTATTRNWVPGAPTTAITNVTTLTSYDALGRTVSSTDALGHTSRMGYNGLSQTVIVTDTVGRVSRSGYDGSGALRWSQRNDGQLTVVQIDGLGRTVATIANYQDGVVAATESSDQDLIRRTVYDAGGRTVATIAADGQTSAFAYDGRDRLIAVTEHATSGSCANPPCNVVTQYQYDRMGNRTAIIDANGNVRRFAYNAASEAQSATDALNRTTSWDYDAGGRLTTQHDPRGTSNDVSYGYDDLDRPTQISASNLGTISTQYDALGQRLRLTDATGSTTFGYDALGHTTRVSAPNTGTIGYGYDANGQRTQLAYPGGPTLQYGYWPDGQIRTVTDTTTLASYTYDAVGRPATVTRANGQVTTYSYDDADRLSSLTTSVGGTAVSSFEYQTDRAGLRTAMTEILPLDATINCSNPSASATPMGAGYTDDMSGTITFSGSWEHLNAVDNPDVSHSDLGSLSRTHTAGARATLTFTGSRIAYVYSMGPNRGSMRVCIDGQTQALVNAYAPEYRRGIVRTWPVSAGTHTIELVAQGDGYLDLDGLAVDSNYHTAGTYDDTDGWFYYFDAGEWTASTSYPNALNSTMHYSDVAGALVRFTFYGTQATLLYSSGPDRTNAILTIDGVDAGYLDQRTASYQTNQTWTSAALSSGYHTIVVHVGPSEDGRKRVSIDGIQIANTPALAVAWIPEVQVVDYTRMITYSYDGLQRLSGAGETPGAAFGYTYDLVGNRTAVWTRDELVTQHTFAYDAANQVVGWSYDAAGNLLSDGSTTSAYDALGRVVQQGATANSYNGDGALVAQASSGATTRYTQDLAAPLSQVLQISQGGTTTSYLYGAERLAAKSGSTRTWYATDALGSVRQTLDDSGTPLGGANYDPWGQVESSSLTSPFGFTGELQQGGSVYLRARWYNAASGTFTGYRWRTDESDDTLPYTHHGYAYALGKPVLFLDPTGRCATTRSDANCWQSYTKAVTSLHFRPDGLKTWSKIDLDHLMSWLDGGVAFAPASVLEPAADKQTLENLGTTICEYLSDPYFPSGNSWNADNIRDVIEGLDRISRVLGNKTDEVLGIRAGSIIGRISDGQGYTLPKLIFKKVEAGNLGDGEYGIGGRYVYPREIYLFAPSSSSYDHARLVDTTIHEVGHLIDFRAAYRIHGSHKYWSHTEKWANATGWAQGFFGKWSLANTTDAQQTVSRHAKDDPTEDFADTFGWYIEQTLGNTYKLQKLGSPSNARRDAMRDFISSLP